NMAVNPDILQKVNNESQLNSGNGEQLFLIRTAGDNTTIEGTLSDGEESNGGVGQGNENVEKIIIYNNHQNNEEGKPCEKICLSHGGPVGASVWAYHNNDFGNHNCAALGVRVNPSKEEGGC